MAFIAVVIGAFIAVLIGQFWLVGGILGGGTIFLITK